jgi:double-stranded uracil-DNA glycosylase
MGITNLVERATVRASELTSEELRAGGERLLETVAVVQPRVVAVAGVTAYRDAFGDRAAVIGRHGDWGSSEVWVLPNPSGLNAHVTIAGLAGWFAEVAGRAGIQ